MQILKFIKFLVLLPFMFIAFLGTALAGANASRHDDENESFSGDVRDDDDEDGDDVDS